ncbi:putative glutamate receptor [Nymphon striatum]|nr:putative glutamate receptor [Nymphon striatum]
MVEASIDSSDEDIFQNYAGKNGIKPYRFEPKRRRLNVDQHVTLIGGIGDALLYVRNGQYSLYNHFILPSIAKVSVIAILFDLVKHGQIVVLHVIISGAENQTVTLYQIINVITKELAWSNVLLLRDDDHNSMTEDLVKALNSRYVQLSSSTFNTTSLKTSLKEHRYTFGRLNVLAIIDQPTQVNPFIKEWMNESRTLQKENWFIYIANGSIDLCDKNLAISDLKQLLHNETSDLYQLTSCQYGRKGVKLLPNVHIDDFYKNKKKQKKGLNLQGRKFLVGALGFNFPFMIGGRREGKYYYPEDGLDVRIINGFSSALNFSSFRDLGGGYLYRMPTRHSIRYELLLYIRIFGPYVQHVCISNYDILHVQNGKWGSLLPDGSWNGMIGMLERKEVDIAVSGLSRTTARLKVADFSNTYLFNQLTFATIAPQEISKVQAPIVPFQKEVWLAYMGCLIITALFLTFMATFDHKYLKSDLEIKNDPNYDKFSVISVLGNNFWYMYGASLMQGKATRVCTCLHGEAPFFNFTALFSSGSGSFQVFKWIFTRIRVGHIGRIPSTSSREVACCAKHCSGDQKLANLGQPHVASLQAPIPSDDWFILGKTRTCLLYLETRQRDESVHVKFSWGFRGEVFRFNDRKWDYFFDDITDLISVILYAAVMRLSISGHTPSHTGVKILISAWWLLVITLLASYGAMLTSFLTYPGKEDAIDTMVKLGKAVREGRINCGAQKGTSHYNLFAGATSGLFKEIGENIKADPNNAVPTIKDGLAKVLKEKNYVYIGGYLRVRANMDDENLFLFSKEPFTFYTYNVALRKEDAIHIFKDGKYFSTLDAKSSYWTKLLDEKCQLLTDFNTPFKTALLKNMNEAGLINKWMEILMNKHKKQSSALRSAERPIQLKDLQGAFLIIGFGFIVSMMETSLRSSWTKEMFWNVRLSPIKKQHQLTIHPLRFSFSAFLEPLNDRSQLDCQQHGQSDMRNSIMLTGKLKKEAILTTKF